MHCRKTLQPVQPLSVTRSQDWKGLFTGTGQLVDTRTNFATMIESRAREVMERWFCCCVGENQGLWDDGKAVESPVRIGLSILFYGKRKSAFPYHCMVGPDWPFVAGVFFLIISINIVTLYIISPIGWIPVIIGLIGAVALLCAYAQTVFSDPGIVYKNEYPAAHTDQRDLEASVNPTSATPINTATVMPVVPHTIECGHCDMRRPYTARHCEYCKLCIDNLDHHCPWSGKCIGEKNIKAFYCFTSMLCFQVYYLMGAFVYFLVYITAGAPHGASF